MASLQQRCFTKGSFFVSKDATNNILVEKESFSFFLLYENLALHYRGKNEEPALEPFAEAFFNGFSDKNLFLEITSKEFQRKVSGFLSYQKPRFCLNVYLQTESLLTLNTTEIPPFPDEFYYENSFFIMDEKIKTYDVLKSKNQYNDIRYLSNF